MQTRQTDTLQTAAKTAIATVSAAKNKLPTYHSNKQLPGISLWQVVSTWADMIYNYL